MRIALAGLGNVGAATVRLLQTNHDLIASRGIELDIVAVSARDRGKLRTCDLSDVEWFDDPLALAEREDVDVVVELIGGADGPALDLARSALSYGKHLITANKAMIAAQGVELAGIAEQSELQLSFEAAVCGGIPILKTLREGLAANTISELRGILNGTSNYILTRMSIDGMRFDAALQEAQERGYAESDPTADVEGYDAANKLAILSALAFGIVPDLSMIAVEGIRGVTQAELMAADTRGGCIKLLATASLSEAGVLQQVRPVFVPFDEPIGRVGGVFNAIEISGDFVGNLVLQGPGAGGDATASAVVADLMDLARGHRSFAFGMPADKLKRVPKISID